MLLFCSEENIPPPGKESFGYLDFFIFEVLRSNFLSK
jgi:hypothetical protein